MNKKITSIIISGILVIILLALGVVIIFLIGEKTGELEFNLFRNDKTGIAKIIVFPEGSEVFIDGQSVGVSPLEIDVRTGTHKLRITNKSFEPYETKISIQSRKITKVEYKLKYKPKAKLINEDVGFSSWTTDNQLLFYQNSNGEIHSYFDDDQVIFEIPNYLLSISFSPRGDSYVANIFPALIPSLNFGQINGGEIKEIGSGECPVYWMTDNSIVTICWEPGSGYSILDDLKIWYGNPNETLQVYQSENLGDYFPVKEIRGSSNGELLSFLNHEGLSIWMIDGHNINHVYSIPSIISAEWDPTNPYRLGCIDSNSTFHKFVLENGKFTETKINYINSPFQWIPDSDSIIYPIYNFEEGGSSFYKLDINNQSKEILVDPQIARGKVESFALSGDGRQIAYITDQSHLWVITIEE